MRWLRRITRRFGRSPLFLVYHRDYEYTMPAIPLDPQRGARILAFLHEEGLVRRREIADPRPASMEAILRVHTTSHVESLDRVETATQVFGVPVLDDQRQRVLELQRLAAGGTIQAVRLARRTGRIAVNLGGGLHHATADRGMAFCMLNDIAIAIAHLRRHGFTERVLVIDLDLHDGNGTRGIFADDSTVHTFSIHNNDWEPLGGIESTSIALGTGVADDIYLTALRESLPPVIAAYEPAFVIYVAGTDPAEDDRLGDWMISAAGMLDRDRFVLDEVRRLREDVPLAVVLAGGYGGGAWRYTARFLSLLLAGHVVEPPDDLTVVLRQFRYGREALLEQEPDDGWGLTEDDLVGIAPGAPRRARVLGAFSRHGIELSLERVGFLEEIRRCGFEHPTVDVDFSSGLGETIRLWGDVDRRELLVELRLNRNTSAVPGMEVLYVEWLLLQNPRAQFSDAMPRLPGQEHPGLGLLREVVAWLVMICETIHVDGMAFAPSHFYMAVLGRHHVRFLDPVAQDRFEALHRAVARLPLPEAARALAEGRVVDAATGRPVVWHAELQVYPVSERMKQIVGRKEGRVAQEYHFKLLTPSS